MTAIDRIPELLEQGAAFDAEYRGGLSDDLGVRAGHLGDRAGHASDAPRRT